MYNQAGSRDDSDLLKEPYWDILNQELDQWQKDGRTAIFWWRDDGAGKLNNQLDRLLKLRKKLDISIALSAIPTLVDNLFWSRLSHEESIEILQNGYSHYNFADTYEAKTELNGTRPIEHILADLAVGMQKRAQHPKALPVLVPPWNHIAPQLIPLLPEIGYCGLSSLGPRPSPMLPPTLKQNNVHISPFGNLNNKDTHTFLGTQLSISKAIINLKDTRTKKNNGRDIIGLLSQHDIQDEDTWVFIEKFITYTKYHQAVKWTSASDVFGITE